MTNLYLFYIFLIFALSSYFIYKKFIPAFVSFIPDSPNTRSSHSKVIPRGGGLIFSLLGLFSLLFSGNLSQFFCMPLAFIGFLDDKFNLSPLIRYFSQIITAVVCLIYSDNILEIFASFSNPFLFSFLYFLFLIVISAIINFSNFMDGIDGLVASCFFIIFGNMIFNGEYDLIPVTGALFGFLIWNWTPAKIFMGDIGSTFLGALFAFKIFNLNSLSLFFAYLIVASPLFADALISIIRRFINRQNIFKPHNLHLYQRLYQAGWKHDHISIIYVLFTLSFCLTLNIFGFKYLIIIFFLMLMTGYYLERKYALPFKRN